MRVDHDGLRPLQAGDFAGGADAKDLVAAHGHGLRGRAAPVRRIDGGVGDDEIHRPIVVVALGPDDEAGDEGRRDDRDNDVSGQAGRHGSSGKKPRFGTGAGSASTAAEGRILARSSAGPATAIFPGFCCLRLCRGA